MTIFATLIKSYAIILGSVGLCALTIFSLGIYFILKKANAKAKESDPVECIPMHTFNEEEVHDHPIKEVKKATIEELMKPSNVSPTEQQQPRSIVADVSDLSAIAGDDIITTQLDLAHACIESGREKMAKQILKRVMEQGNAQEQKEAARLLMFLNNKMKINIQ